MTDAMFYALLAVLSITILASAYVAIEMCTSLVVLAKKAMEKDERERIDHDRASQIFLEKIQGDREHQLRLADIHANEGYRRWKLSLERDKPTPEINHHQIDHRAPEDIPVHAYDTGD